MSSEYTLTEKTIAFVISAVILLLLGLALIGMLVAGYNVGRQRAIDDTYTTCQTSRISATISEEQCARMQDRNNLEYLCKERNNLTTNHCWIEEK